MTERLILTLCLMLFSNIGCMRSIALLTSPDKKPEVTKTPLFIKAERNFWSTLHTGEYAKVDEVIKLLQAAYIENPNNGILATHLGFAYMWKSSERRHDKEFLEDPKSINGFDLASRYLEEGYNLRKDPRTLGFADNANMTAGTIHKDQYRVRKGCFQAKEAIDHWPD